MTDIGQHKVVFGASGRRAGCRVCRLGDTTSSGGRNPKWAEPCDPTPEALAMFEKNAHEQIASYEDDLKFAAAIRARKDFDEILVVAEPTILLGRQNGFQPSTPLTKSDTGISAIVATIDDVRPHGDNLSIVTVAGNEVVANRREDGSFRWEAGQTCVYVPEGAHVPEDVLRERGYWDDAKGKGLLDGNKGNRTKMRRFAGHESRGLLFVVLPPGQDWLGECPKDTPHCVSRGNDTKCVAVGDNVAEFLGITQHKAE